MKILEIQKVDLASFCYLDSERYPFLLESVNHNDINRYSILFAFPGESIILNSFSDFDFLNELKNQFKPNNLNSDLPFVGGWFVYLSYELIEQIEPSLSYEVYRSNLPIAYAVVRLSWYFTVLTRFSSVLPMSCSMTITRDSYRQ